jgi:AcrR family transcriptional regulator
MATPAGEGAGGQGGAGPSRGRGRPAATDSRDTRARILEAALKLFGNGSYVAVSMVAVGAESGVDKRTVRYHFGSKRELFEAARAEAFRRFVDEARRRVFSHDTARGRLKGWVDTYRNLHAFDTDVLRFMGFAVAEGITEPDNQVSLVEAGAELFGLLSEVVEEAMASGELNPAVDVAAAVQMVAAISIGMSLMSMSPGPYPETLDALDLVFAGDFFVAPSDEG